MPGMERLFEATLHGYSITEIEEGFRLYFSEPQESVFMPKPGEIILHIDRLRERKAFQKQAESTDAYLDDLRKTRETLKANGNAYGPEQFNQVLRMGADIVERIQRAKQVEFDPVKRRAELEEQRKQVMAKHEA